MGLSLQPMKHAKLLLVAPSLVSVFAMGTAAHATGTAAGTLIQNTATATYSSGTATGTVQSNTVSVKVDELLNVAVTSLNSSSVSASSTAAVLTYSVVNTGNGTEPFNITVDPNISGNGFNGTIQSVVLDNGNGIYEPGIDTVIANGAASPSILADGSLTVFVLVALPGGATDAQVSQVRLTATSVTPRARSLPARAMAGLMRWLAFPRRRPMRWVRLPQALPPSRSPKPPPFLTPLVAAPRFRVRW